MSIPQPLRAALFALALLLPLPHELALAGLR